MKGRQFVEEKHGSSNCVSRGQISSQAPGIFADWRSGSNFFQKKGTGKQWTVATLCPPLWGHLGASCTLAWDDMSVGEFNRSQEPQIGYFRNQNLCAQNLLAQASGGLDPPHTSDPPGCSQ